MRTKLFTTALSLVLSAFLAAQTNTKTLKFKTSTSKSKVATMSLDNIETLFSYIPMQTYRTEDNRFVSVKSFYMLRIEVPNMMYKLFINDLKLKGKTDELKIAMPDTNAWGVNNQPYSTYYFQHPAYNSYPIISVSRKGVKMFCEWLSERVKNLKLKEWKNKKITFRLPNEAEWMVAASGGDTGAVYAWKGPFMTMGDGPYKGDYKANFRRVADGNVFRGEDGKLVIKKIDNKKLQNYFTFNTTADITASVNNYWPNAYGLFCMTGNVREMVQEEGFTKGGSWFDPGGECTIDFRNTYHEEGFPCEGFRIVAIVE